MTIPPLAANLLLDAILAASAVAWIRRRGVPSDLPIPRMPRALLLLLLVAFALAVAWPALSLPYLSDDWWHLEVKGEKPTPFHSMAPEPGYMFLRPVSYAFWWFYARLAPQDALLPHATVAVVLALAAGAAIGAFRRCGVPRATATAAGFLLIAHPAALHTISSAHNLYPPLSAGLAFASLATLPRATAGARARIASTVLGMLAFLSKEDSFVLPAMAFLVGARFRPRLWRQGLVAAAPLAVALAVVVAARFPILGHFGGYSAGSTGSAFAPERYALALVAALQLHIPASLLLPSRGGLLFSVILASSLLLATGRTAAARRSIPRAILFAALAVAPGLPLWGPIEGSALSAGHLLLFPAAGVALAAAACCAGASGPPRVRLLLLASFATIGIVTGRANFAPWRVAAETSERAAAIVTDAVASAPRNARLVVYGLPDSVEGVVTFRNALPHFVRLVADRRDLTGLPPERAVGLFDALLEIDLAAPRANLRTSLEAERTLGPGEVLDLDLAEGSPDRRRCDAFDLQLSDGADGVWRLRSSGLDGVLALPAVRVPAGARARLEIDGATRSHDGVVSPVLTALVVERPTGLERMLLADAEGPIPEGTAALRLEILVLRGDEVVLRRVRLAIAPPR